MEGPLENLTASDLRRLLILEIHKFIKCIDDGSFEELKLLKAHSTEMLNLISFKELQEKRLIEWGKNYTQRPIPNPGNNSIAFNMDESFAKPNDK
ncbi:hypothetical protein Q4E93_22095 [Flavitalea sp. BT771]|uniref:hypothetical protein n=1 Tax=Flavitalea sp. BT771 TaxID=3063329 RepID=UPI0026E18E14|nr:hypothetical protein [Flavitalea sp. BT771]MDO6433319.1 hypothetical protein [Flavitalea sp. BT771]MDV6222776.1 hypothetical protein [Flavitalea sp. BT771]